MKTLRRRVKRLTLTLGLVVFCGICYASYVKSHALLSGKVGGILTWSLAALVLPAIDTMPAWLWVSLLGAALYLWYKHTLIMSVIYGMLAGIYFAT
ncbi:hypothetical protein GF339_02050 [candidate division KSB3 bacterium]|uniref:Uncharacterized protein n=1 Tax=candidate division KSB3 bacterium TaxID=2044937 RepID=A0A9D5JSA4_9BACT|nr:hypothetical protein [candidate division KSB3 bacterium]MBD3323334.1 hypothetical protein [candidate division KSB3 bacterium]